jgi:DNA-binding CsgD family transcriptional regulator/tetratricopeptide (TPR) repeat protein
VGEVLEREELVEALSGLLGGGHLVFVGGEAGVGKTTLVRALAEQARCPVLRGSCEHLATPTPFGPFVDVAASTDGLGGLLGDGADPRTVARAVLDELAAPALVVLEDVHWADEATLDAIRVLGRRIDQTRGLVVATYRDDEVDGDHPLRLVLGQLVSAPHVSRLTVPPLSLEAVRLLAEPSGADGDAIHALTGGNAFYVTEVLAVGSDRLPETVRDAVLARVSPLGPGARPLLEVVALVPGRTELWLVEAVAPDTLEHLDGCLAAGVLREDGAAIAFRHELARRVVEGSVSATRSRRLHTALLESLRTSGPEPAPASRLAHHAEHAGDTAAVLEHAPRAAREAAALGAHREAAEQYARAIRFAADEGDRARAELLDAYALECQLTGRSDEAAAVWREAAGLYRAVGDRRREGVALAWLTRALVPIGRNAEAELASREAIGVLEEVGPGPELARAYASQAYMRMLSRDNADGVMWGERAAELATRFDDPDTLAYALNMIGTSHLMAGETDVGVERLLESLRIARERNLWIWIGPALSMLGTGLGEMFELSVSERYLREHLAWAEENDLWPYYSLAWLSLVETYSGRWDLATATATDVLSKADDSISRISALIAMGRVRARRGDPGAMDVLDQALELATPGGHLQRLGHARAARAEALWLIGDADGAAREARAAYDLAVEKRHLWFTGELAYWQHRAGALDRWPAWIAEPWRLQLAGSARAAAEAWRAHGCPYEAARSLAELDDEQALLDALSELERLGAGPAAVAVRRRLRELDLRVPRGRRATTRANPGELTTRELDVLRLVVDGKRNGEIAAELVVSRRTVDHHVSAILRKLDVRSRGEATAAARERGLLDPR